MNGKKLYKKTVYGGTRIWKATREGKSAVIEYGVLSDTPLTKITKLFDSEDEAHQWVVKAYKQKLETYYESVYDAHKQG